MSRLVQAKLALVVMGLIIWAWGYRVDDSFLRIAGIVLLLIAFLLRFIGRRPRPPEAPKDKPRAS
jgi:predicted membrane protein